MGLEYIPQQTFAETLSPKITENETDLGPGYFGLFDLFPFQNTVNET